MALTPTNRTQRILGGLSKQPNIVLEIDGVEEVFGAVEILKNIRIGDPGLTIGNSWKIGGLNEVDEQASVIMFGGKGGGTDTDISQQVNVDSSESSNTQTLRVALQDKSGTISELISPGVIVDDILGRKVKVWYGFANSAWKEDYVLIFRGIIGDVQSAPGRVVFTLSHPDRKKNQAIYNSFEGKLNEPLDASETTITLVSTTNLLSKITGPDGSVDTAYKHYIRVDDEIIEFAAISGNDLTGCTRASLGTTAATHLDQADVKSVHRLVDNSMALALKLMLSGWNGPFITGLSAKNFVRISGSETVANCLFFDNKDLEVDHGLTEGDFITTTGAADAANNVTLKPILQVAKTQDGSYVVVDDVSFVEEADTAVSVSFRSKYDTLPDGLAMSPDEVDVAQHEKQRSLFLQNFDYDFYLQDSIDDARKFIVEQIYRPASTLEIVRKSRASCKFQIGPLPDEDLPVLDETVLEKASGIMKRRSMGRNFFNQIIYKFDPHPIKERWSQGTIYADNDSRERIGKWQPFAIESQGLRDANIIQTVADRRLRKYAFAAEYYEGLSLGLKAGFTIENGDIVIFDGSRIRVTDTSTGSRSQPPKLLEVVSKKLNLRTGKVQLQLIDTNYDVDARYALISPASFIKVASDQANFIIEPSFSQPFGNDEWRKWKRYEGAIVRVRAPDWSESATAVLELVNFNLIRLDANLGFVPSAGYVMELCDYNDATEVLKLKYGWMTDEDLFDDGTSQYKMI